MKFINTFRFCRQLHPRAKCRLILLHGDMLAQGNRDFAQTAKQIKYRFCKSFLSPLFSSLFTFLPAYPLFNLKAFHIGEPHFPITLYCCYHFMQPFKVLGFRIFL